MIDRLGFGCVALTGFATPAQALRVLNTAFELGVTHFDTAPVYGQGYSERILGQFLRGRRDQVTVATKFGLRPSRAPNLPVAAALAINALRRGLASGRPRPVAAAAPPPPEPSPDAEPSRRIDRDEVQSAFNASCRALGVDYIDLYLLHEEVPAALTPEALALLRDLKSSGRVRRIGVAANVSRTRGLDPSDVADWDVLQYEAGPMWPDADGLLQRFPNQQHVFHSCLRGVVSDTRTAGQVLAERLAENPNGLVLFSSTKIEHLRANLRALAG